MRRVDFTNTQVASSETARDINRVVVLNLIRRRQPISRADLARASGLQRSTISEIVEQLMDEQWVVSGPTGRLPRGRHPTYLRLNERRTIPVADIRPLQTTVGVADVNGRFLAQDVFPTSPDPARLAQELAVRILRWIQAHPQLSFEGIGISVPGRFDDRTQRVVFAPNLHWPEFGIKEALETRTGLRVELENAANACVLAEIWFGTAEHLRDLVVVTVSEGIGTGVLLNGQLARGLGGMAGEFGHVQLDAQGPLCSCGSRGCWEVLASNRAALRYYSESGQNANGITFDDLLLKAQSGDEPALAALDRMAHQVGRGMRMIVAGLAPEDIVVVGELTKLWHRLGPVITAETAAGVLVGNPPLVRPAEGQMARLRGSVALVLQRHFGLTRMTHKRNEIHREQSLAVAR